jgi:hypothetical protein
MCKDPQTNAHHKQYEHYCGLGEGGSKLFCVNKKEERNKTLGVVSKCAKYYCCLNTNNNNNNNNNHSSGMSPYLCLKCMIFVGQRW